VRNPTERGRAEASRNFAADHVFADHQQTGDTPMRTIFVAAAALALLVGSAASPVFAQGKQDKAASKFLNTAIEGNYAEMKMGELAQSKGQSDGVKSFGQTLVTDHGAANQKAMGVAKSMGMTPPSGPNAKQRADYQKMQGMSGAAFDKAFAQHMVQDHKKAIKDYEKAAKGKGDAAQYASGTLPTLKQHLQTAQSLSSGKATTGMSH
jgi:putative membrane protein